MRYNLLKVLYLLKFDLGSVFVSDHNEEYVMTFPNAYGRLEFYFSSKFFCFFWCFQVQVNFLIMMSFLIIRSILTVPWVELAGRTEITCAKSGYSSQIELHTKVRLLLFFSFFFFTINNIPTALFPLIKNYIVRNFNFLI